MALLAVLLLADVNATALLERVVANRAPKDFSLKARLFVTRDKILPVEILVKSTATETRTIYRSGTNEVLIVQPVSGETRYFLRGAKVTDKFLDSEFTYYDLGLPFLHWPEAKSLGQDRVRGRDCHLIEVRASGQPYARAKLWIDKEYPALFRVEAFDADNPVKRIAITSFKRIGELWIPRGIECATVPGHQALPAQDKSRLEIYDGDYDAKLPAEWFSEARFGTGRTDIMLSDPLQAAPLPVGEF